MKIWIHAASDRAAAYQAKQEEKRLSKSKEQARIDYVRSIEGIVFNELGDAIYDTLFSPFMNSSAFHDYAENYFTESSKYHNPEIDGSLEDYHASLYDGKNNAGAKCWLNTKPDCMKLTVDVFSGPGSDHNWGLEWLADLESGGDGSNRCIYVSAMPARMKRKMNEYQEQIIPLIENLGLGLEVLGPAKYNSDGFWYPVINDEYEALI